MVLGLLLSAALAQADVSAEALARLEESLVVRIETDVGALDDLTPVLVVSLRPYYESTRSWFPGEALSTLSRVFDADALRMCEACQVPRTFVEKGVLQQASGPLSLEELKALDARNRGTRAPARTALWLDETHSGVSYRFVSLEDGHIVLAANVDPTLEEQTRSIGTFNLAREAERRARGDAITHGIADFVLYPGQHISVEWVDQWGSTNRNMSGFVVSLFDPVFGVGGVYHRIFPEIGNLSVGGKVILSVPTALVESLADNTGDVVDPVLTGVAMVRWPIFDSNYALTFSASTNGNIGVGLSLLNSTFIPFLL